MSDRGGLEGIVEDGDKIRGKESDHASVAAESASPPGAISGIQAFDQIAFYEAEVFLGL